MNYDPLAPLYDTIMSHVDYRQWRTLTEKILSDYTFETTPDLLEIGAGTGTLSLLLREIGLDPDLFDLSFGMTKVAKQKNLPVFCADGKHIPLKKKYDIVLFLYDGINYLSSFSEYDSLFKEVLRLLKPNGLFLFDITTEFNSKNNFRDVLDFEDHDEFSYVRHSYYNEKKSIQHNDFTIFTKTNDDLFYRDYDFHRQFVLKPEKIKSMIPLDSFSIEGIWDDFSQNPYVYESERVHFLLRKIAS